MFFRLYGYYENPFDLDSDSGWIDIASIPSGKETIYYDCVFTKFKGDLSERLLDILGDSLILFQDIDYLHNLMEEAEVFLASSERPHSCIQHMSNFIESVIDYNNLYIEDYTADILDILRNSSNYIYLPNILSESELVLFEDDSLIAKTSEYNTVFTQRGMLCCK